MTVRIPAWSFSRLSVFERCRYQLKLNVIDKSPQGTRAAADRGTHIHGCMEDYIIGKDQKLAPELSSFSDEINNLKTRYASKQVDIEQNWAFDRTWQPVADWYSKEAWCRVKLDAMVKLTPQHGVVIDLKTGKKSGNEIKHADQGQLYAGATFLKYPKLKHIDVEFWYSDHDDLTNISYTPEDAAKFIVSFEKRGRQLTEATQFPPNPSIFTCRICDYRNVANGGTGACDFAVNANKFIKPKRRYF